MGAATNDSGAEENSVGGFPPAKRYADTISSRLFNETGIYPVSSLAYLTGYIAFHNREQDITGSPVVKRNELKTLDVTGRNFSLYCSNCIGKTEVNLYNIAGQLLKNETAVPEISGYKITGYESLVGKYPLILYKIIDETGRIKSGKITVSGGY